MFGLRPLLGLRRDAAIELGYEILCKDLNALIIFDSKPLSILFNNFPSIESCCYLSLGIIYKHK